MMRIFIVTYKNNKALKKNLISLWNSDVEVTDNIYIINNYETITYLSGVKYNRIRTINNYCRPDFSTGHLSRNWNQALLLGFENLQNPATDIVCAVQDDIVWRPNWRKHLLELMNKYTYVQMGAGDEFQAWRPEAVKKIGLYDERFCAIALQEADYFLRAAIYSSRESTINDSPRHKRLLNPEWEYRDKTIQYAEVNTSDQHEYRKVSMNMNTKLCQKLWRHKWASNKFEGGYVPWERWGSNKVLENLPNGPAVSSYMYYPYFEKDIEGLKEKGYVV